MMLLDDAPRVLGLLEVRVRVQKEHLLNLPPLGRQRGTGAQTWSLRKKLGRFFMAFERSTFTLPYWPGCCLCKS